jgi:photosystem II stability/assembly factor-like uncharacterized protein
MLMLMVLVRATSGTVESSAVVNEATDNQLLVSSRSTDMVGVASGNITHLYQTSVPYGSCRALSSDATGQNLLAAVVHPWPSDDPYSVYKYYWTVYLSHDYGVSWSSTALKVELYINFDTLTFFATSDSTGCYLVVGCRNTMTFVSLDCGNTWVEPEMAGSTNVDVAADISGRNLVSTNGYNIFLSKTYGLVFEYELYREVGTDYSSVSSSSNGEVLAAAFCMEYTNTLDVYVAGNASETNITWTFRNFTSSNSCTDVSLSSNGAGDLLVLVVGYRIYASRDYGNSWSNFTNSLPSHVWWTTASCDSLGQRIVLGGHNSSYYGVLYASADYGETWARVETGNSLISTDFVSVMSYDGSFLAAGTNTLQNSFAFIIQKGYVYSSADPSFTVSYTATSTSPTLELDIYGLQYSYGAYYLSVSLISTYIPASVRNQLMTIAVRNSTDTNKVDVLFSGVCAAKTICDDQNDPTLCAVNLPVMNGYIQNNVPYQSDGYLRVIITLSTAEPVGVCGDSTYFTVACTVSATQQPVDYTRPAFYSYSVILAAVAVMTVLCGLFGFGLVRIYQASSTIRTMPSLRIVLFFTVTGLLVSLEIWFLGIFQRQSNELDMSSFQFLSYTFVLSRVAFVVPGSFQLMKLFGHASVKSEVYEEQLDQLFIMNHPALIYCLSIFLLLDPRLIIYFPWLQTLPFEDNFGYPDAIMLDLCSIFKALISVASLIAQLVLYGQMTSSNWGSSDVLVRTLLILYTVLYTATCAPTFGVMYSYLLETFASVPMKRLSYRRQLGQLLSRITSVEISSRWQRFRQLPSIPFRVWFSVSKSAFLLFLYISILTWECRPPMHQGYTPLSPDRALLWLLLFFACAIASLTTLALELFVLVEYCDIGEVIGEGYDPHLQMLSIASTFSLDAEKMTTLLQPTMVFFSMLETFMIVCLYVIYGFLKKLLDHYRGEYIRSFDDYDNCHQSDALELSYAYLVLILLCIELLSPFILWAVKTWKETGSFKEAVRAGCRIDICGTCLFLKLMLTGISPLCLLTNISIMKAQVAQTRKQNQSTEEDATTAPDFSATSDLLSFQLRDNWASVDEAIIASGAPGSNVSYLAYVAVVMDRLLKRFTVVYSFLKLCGTIAFTLFINRDFLSCHNMDSYATVATCPVTYEWLTPITPTYFLLSSDHPCKSTCLNYMYPSRYVYPTLQYEYSPPLPPESWTCQVEISGECICSNWFTFQFTIIFLHVIHYVVQCYFYIRYNYFDPQQNQINCVETYTFAGENLTLFLTKPSLCLLSTIEAICIVIVWAEVILRPGGYCNQNNSALSLFDLQFAIFITFIEIYKANLSTCGKCCSKREYWWALWSLVRIDLFVFYGFTLFLQSFFFPFSLLGYSVVKYAKLAGTSINGTGLTEPLLNPICNAVGETNDSSTDKKGQSSD